MDINNITKEDILKMSKKEIIKYVGDIFKRDCFEMIEAVYKNNHLEADRILLNLFECSIASAIGSKPKDEYVGFLDKFFDAMKNDIIKMITDIEEVKFNANLR